MDSLFCALTVGVGRAGVRPDNRRSDMLIESLAFAALSIASRCESCSQPPASVLTLDGRDRGAVWLWHRTIGTASSNPARSIGVAERISFPRGRADSVSRPGFNGRDWSGESCVGGVDRWTLDESAARYGAAGDADLTVPVRVGQFIVQVNPFERIDATGKEMPRKYMAAIEDARNQWLRDHGYVGGVRSFTNSAAVTTPKPSAIDLTPKAVFPAPTDQPRFRNRMEVRANPVQIHGVTRVSLPPTFAFTAPPVVLASK